MKIKKKDGIGDGLKIPNSIFFLLFFIYLYDKLKKQERGNYDIRRK